MRKKFAIILVLLITASSLSAFAQTPTFRDVPVTHFAYEAINWVSDPENGAFMVGDAGNNFHPGRHLNKFEAAQIYAMAAGFRHVTSNLPPAEREIFTRSFDTWRPLLDSLAAEYSSWNRTVDREIAYLLYREIITVDEVQNFVGRTGQTEQRPLLTREEAVTWMVRLVGQSANAQAITLPHHTPFMDDAQISEAYRRYIYHARDLGIIHGSGGYMNPTAHFTRAEMATVFYNALANRPQQNPAQAGAPATVSGTIANIHLDTHVSVTSASGTETFEIAPNAVIMIDNTQRTASFLRAGMTTTVLVDTNRRIISMVARTQTTDNASATQPTTPSQSMHSDEGFVTAVSSTPSQTVTIRTQRVRISGQIIDEERTFSFAPNAVITHNGAPATFADIQVGDIAYFGFNQSTILNIELMERERTILGILTNVRPPDSSSGNPILIIEETEGRSYELRALPATEFSRGEVRNLNWDDLRVGDAITAEVELDRLINVHAVGERSETEGRLSEIRIIEHNTEISVVLNDDTTATYIVRPGMFDVYTLRIGMQLRISLDSREVVSIQIQSNAQTNPNIILGFIQSIRPDGTIVISEGQGANARIHTISVPPTAAITRSGAVINASQLRVNMNVYIVLTASGSNIAQSITVLP